MERPPGPLADRARDMTRAIAFCNLTQRSSADELRTARQVLESYGQVNEAADEVELSSTGSMRSISRQKTSAC